MSLNIGAHLGPYEILGALGAGGMGEVWRARDTRLGREVALKLLPAELAGDPERLARFEREAKMLASLGHPNIAVLYGFEHVDGQHALTMELVEGEGLDQRIGRGAVPLDEAIPIALQIAEALEAAHEKGIVHRDVKPGNVKVRPDGVVKVLDFGLAKVWEEQVQGTDPAFSPTVTGQLTRAGVVLGTAPYMSPEQARGKPVDKRADIWAFGVVLFELLTGTRLFTGQTLSDVFAGILTKEPDWSALPAPTPPSVTRLLRRCLERDPKQRLRDIGEARLVLSERADSSQAPAQPPVQPGSASRRRPALWAAVVLTAVASGLASVWTWTRLHAPAALPVTRLSIALPSGGVLTGSNGPVVSRDGRLVAYTARDAAGVSRLYTRALDRYEARVVPGSEGAEQPFFSPDGGRVGFFANGKLLTASVLEGIPTKLADASSIPFGATWGEDDTIVFVPSLSSGLRRVPSFGGAPQSLTEPDEVTSGYAHVWPQFLPGGRSVLFTIWGGPKAELRGVVVLSLATGTWVHVASGLESCRYAGSGYLLGSDPRGVVAAAFDPDHPREVRARTFVLEDVFQIPFASSSWFSTSDTGTLAYVPGDLNLSALAWVDLEGRVSPIGGQVASIADATLSPDGTRVVLEDKDDALWVVDLRRGTRSRLTLDHEGNNAYPVWTRDGKRVKFASNRDGDWDIYEAPAGGGPARRILERQDNQFPTSEAPDGTLLFAERAKGTAVDVWTLAPGGAAAPFLVSSFSRVGAQYSPGGRMVAFASDETGRDEVYVCPAGAPGEPVAVSAEGGRNPQWSPDGKQVFYRRGDAFLAASVTWTGSPAAPVVGDSRKLFEIRAASGRTAIHPGYAVSPDGRQLLVLLLDPRAIPTQINVVTNWFAEVRAKVPSP